MVPFDERYFTEITDLNLSDTPVMVNGVDSCAHQAELLEESQGVIEDSKESKEFFSNVRWFRQSLFGSESMSVTRGPDGA